MGFYSLMHSGAIYDPGEDSIMEEQLKCLDHLYDFNATDGASKASTNAQRNVCGNR